MERLLFMSIAGFQVMGLSDFERRMGGMAQWFSDASLCLLSAKLREKVWPRLFVNDAFAVRCDSILEQFGRGVGLPDKDKPLIQLL